MSEPKHVTNTSQGNARIVIQAGQFTRVLRPVAWLFTVILLIVLIFAAGSAR